MLFADDLQILNSHYPNDLIKWITKIEIEAVANYALNNGLKLNVIEYKVIILGSSAFINQIDLTYSTPNNRGQ